MLQSKNQRFSTAVYNNVAAVANSKEALAKKYKGLCKRSGSLLRTSGLMQTVAFMEARGQREGQYHLLLEHLQSELDALKLVTGHQNQKHWLAGHIRRLELPQYMILTRDVLLLLNWHKRLADTLIEGDDDGEGQDND